MNFNEKPIQKKNKRKGIWLSIPITICIILSIIFIQEGKDAEAYNRITYENLSANSTMIPPFTIYSKLKDECYRQEAKNKEHCIKTGLSIAYAESSWKDYQTPFWLQSTDKWYEKWVSSYLKYWYTSTNWHFFYGDYGELWRSHYCTSEESSGSSYGCPNGRKNFDVTFNNLSF